jgi:hypothetical protein
MSRKQIVQPTTVVYVSPEGRVRVERCAGEFDLFLDDRFVKTYVSQFAAEQAGLVWLAEQAAELSADLADEAALAAEYEAYLASLRQPGNVTRAPLVAHPDVQRQRHEVEGVMYVDWTGRVPGWAGVEADRLIIGAKGVQ